MWEYPLADNRFWVVCLCVRWCQRWWWWCASRQYRKQPKFAPVTCTAYFFPLTASLKLFLTRVRNYLQKNSLYICWFFSVTTLNFPLRAVTIPLLVCACDQTAVLSQFSSPLPSSFSNRFLAAAARHTNVSSTTTFLPLLSPLTVTCCSSITSSLTSTVLLAVSVLAAFAIGCSHCWEHFFVFLFYFRRRRRWLYSTLLTFSLLQTGVYMLFLSTS